MKKWMLLMLGGLYISNVWCQQAITLQTLLDEITNASSVTKWPAPEFVMKQASSYDRKSVAPDQPGWYANGDFNQFIRKEQHGERSEFVMMDADGPGAIVRFWLTTVVKPGILRFYFDNEQPATITIPAYDLMKGDFNLGKALLNPHTSYDPKGKGGNTLYLPLPYQQHCKVTFEFTDTATIKTSHYYQINYRTYAAGTKLKTFTRQDLSTYRKQIDKAEHTLWNPPAAKIKSISRNETLGAGKSFSIDLPGGSNAVHQLAVKVTPENGDDLEKALRETILKIEFDDEETVWSPLSDFSGSGYGRNIVKSWYRDMREDGTVVSRWVMPYSKKAKVTLVNQSQFIVNASVSLEVDKWKWDKHSMYFHATYKFSENIRDAKWDYDVTRVALEDSAAPIEWNFINIEGRGVYMGNTFAVDNHMNSWYGEGDAKIWVDNDTFPSEFGTGLEDYYNTSWAPVVLYNTPFANAPRADNENSSGHNTFTRTRNLDGVPFRESFRYDLEMLSWHGGSIDAAATIYWYGAPGASFKK